jgi:hypothetical protein
MWLPNWLKSSSGLGGLNEDRLKHLPRLREGETIAFDLTQNANGVMLKGGDDTVHFAVEGIELPKNVDASFAVWGLLAAAMEGGFNLHINQPIDPVVAANAERLTRIWEMWVPSRYRSVTVSGEGGWSRLPQERLPRIQLYSGGCDSTFAILKHGDPRERGYAATIIGLDYRRDDDKPAFAKLLAKTDPLLHALNYQRIVIRTDANRWPQELTHGLTLAACLFLLSDLFMEGTLPADLTPLQDPVPFPWGTNHLTNQYLAGSDFAVRMVCAETGRTEKLAALATGEALPFLACCRKRKAFPSNCGACAKCVRTKAMLFAATGVVPEIFLNNRLDAQLMRCLGDQIERAELFDLYGYAKDRGIVHKIPGLEDLIRTSRETTQLRKLFT